MQLWVGLGNPGAKYARNRHNIGFMALDRVAEDHGFGPWRSKFQGRLAEGNLGGEKVLLLKPETFMNLSGNSVGEAVRFYKVGPAEVTVFHDEIDLAPAKVRLKTGGGHAGHNGLRSIHGALGPEYHRVRMGVGHPGRKEAVPGYVLHDFAKADAEWLDDVIRGISDGAPDLARGDGGKFSNAIAKRVVPPRPGKPNPDATSPLQGHATQPSKPTPEATPKAAAPPAKTPQSEDAAPVSPLQRLIDKFR